VKKQEKTTLYNVIIIPLKNLKKETNIILRRHCIIKTYYEKKFKAKLTKEKEYNKMLNCLMAL
jgi:hypothetical protein